MKKFAVKKADMGIIAAVLLLAGAAFLCLHFFAAGGAEAVVEQNGTVLATLSLSEDAVYEVKNGNTLTNTVEVKDGAVCVTYADCPDKICQKHRPIKRSGESIVCLPNKVIVTVRGGKTQVDGVAR